MGHAEGVALQKPELPALDAWVSRDLGQLIRAREAPFMTREELSKLMKWKLMKGKWRPRLQAFVDAADPAAVKAATGKAFELAGTLLRGNRHIQQLRMLEAC
jgi:hypothetical protein